MIYYSLNLCAEKNQRNILLFLSRKSNNYGDQNFPTSSDKCPVKFLKQDSTVKDFEIMENFEKVNKIFWSNDKNDFQEWGTRCASKINYRRFKGHEGSTGKCHVWGHNNTSKKGGCNEKLNEIKAPPKIW